MRLNHAKDKGKYLLIIAAAAAVLLAAVFCLGLGAPSDNPVTITIFHTNDMHGNVADLAYVAALKSSTPNALLEDAGDATHGGLLATATNGIAIITLMNTAGYDVMTLGNHELEKGVAHAAKLADIADFPVFSANTIYLNGTTCLNNSGNLILESGGKRIGFFGITTTETNVPYSKFICTDEIAAAKNQTRLLKEMGVDLIVTLVHIGNASSSSPTSYHLAMAVPEIDLIIDDHSHTIIQDKVGNTTIVQTGAFLQNLGRVNVSFTSDGPVIETSLISAKTLETRTVDAAYVELYKNRSDLSSYGYDRIIGSLTVDLIANTDDGTWLAHMQETPLGNLVTDSMHWDAEKTMAGTARGKLPVVAVVNGGGIRAGLAAGN
ncbi:MAG: metallophosphoesterase [Methanocalculaceae archaeon]|nr:metallophosphoesterase [Methanocalculaceae archaeon]